MAVSPVDDLGGWLPIRAYDAGGRLTLDCCWMGRRRLSEPFFDHTVDAALELPFNRLFRRELDISELVEIESGRPPIRIDALVFHLSRCGSTLIAQMLAALPWTVVASEPSIVDGVIRHARARSDVSDRTLATWLGALLGWLVRPRAGRERAHFVKLDPWHTVHLPLFQRAFPETPCVFVYRDPVEVLVSLELEPGGRLIPGAIDPALLDLSMEEAMALDRADYHSRVLRLICDAALESFRPGVDLLVNHDQLPEWVGSVLCGELGFDLSDEDRGRMKERSTYRAKFAGETHIDDTEHKRASATGGIRRAAEQWLAEPYARLESARENPGSDI
ncbi:MAG: sulfotransferase family protein [Candidatus Sulfomarinibacteraceae bacterium]